MRNRIMGEEIEWVGGYFSKLENSWISIGTIFDIMMTSMRFDFGSEFKRNFLNSPDFISNGSRIYRESTGQHFETALPECKSALETLKFDKWSERFVYKISKKLESKIGKIAFYKKNSDSNLECTRSCHENYFSDRIFENLLIESENLLKDTVKIQPLVLVRPEINYFILFLITRQIFTGSGGIMLHSLRSGGYNNIYEISPRTHFIDAVISGATTSSGRDGRAIINTRREPLAKEDKYWRNHLILGDSNMADLSIFLKFGTTSAIIEMIEEGFWDNSLGLANPKKSPEIFKSVSKDLTLRQVLIDLENGEKFTALQIQKKFNENWQAYLKYTNQGGEKAEIAQRWQEVLYCLETDDEKLYGQLDWKIKMRLIQSFMDKKNVSLDHNSVINLDNLYHSPDPDLSFYYKLKNRSGLKIESLVSESEISKADKEPPETRAKLRTDLVKLLSELHLSFTVYWDRINFNSYDGKATDYTIHMFDPRLSSLSSLNYPENAEAIKYLNVLKPNAILV